MVVFLFFVRLPCSPSSNHTIMRELRKRNLLRLISCLLGKACYDVDMEEFLFIKNGKQFVFAKKDVLNIIKFYF